MLSRDNPLFPTYCMLIVLHLDKKNYRRWNKKKTWQNNTIPKEPKRKKPNKLSKRKEISCVHNNNNTEGGNSYIERLVDNNNMGGVLRGAAGTNRYLDRVVAQHSAAAMRNFSALDREKSHLKRVLTDIKRETISLSFCPIWLALLKGPPVKDAK